MKGVTKHQPLNKKDRTAINKAGIQAINTTDTSLEFDGLILYTITPKLSECKQYASDCIDIIKDINCPKAYFEIGKYPNQENGGAYWAWTSGRYFAGWWMQVVENIRSEIPNAKIVYPRLKFGPSIGSFLMDSEEFYRESSPAVECADFISMECQWTGDTDLTSYYNAIYRVAYRVLENQKIFVTFSNANTNVPKSNKGKQYKQFYKEMQKYDQVIASFCHTLSSPRKEDTQYTWISPSGASDILDALVDV